MCKTIAVLLLALVVGLTSCKGWKRAAATTDELSDSEYEALSAYIAEKVGNGKVKGLVKVVISDTTQSWEHDLLPDENGQAIPWEKTAESLRKSDPALQQATINALRDASTQQAAVRRSFQPAIEYELAHETDIDSVFKNGGWDAFYKRFPGSNGIVTFSRVGFSADGRQALFYMSLHCGGLCGGGRFVKMEKHDDHWVVGKETEMWVS